MKKELTDRLAKTLPAGIYWDSSNASPKGFLLAVSPAGARSYRLNYRRASDGVERRLTIGSTSAWSLAEARKRGAAIRRLIDQGEDPLGAAQEKRQAPTIAELIERFVAESLPRRAPRTQREYTDMFKHHILPSIGRLKVTAVERADLERLHARITGSGKLRRANAVLSAASTLFEAAISWGLRAEHTNPAHRVARNPEFPRERYLSDEELDRLLVTLEAHQAQMPDSVDQIRLLMLTGCRRNEVLKMTWAQVDLDAATWTKPPKNPKQGKLHRAPLNVEAVELLKRRRAEREQGRVVRLKDDRVFPSSLAAPHFKLERDWTVIRASAHLENFRLHDLRHSVASWLISRGNTLAVVGSVLGHSKASTTQRYAHMSDAAERAALATVGEIVSGKTTTTR
jgi:integrase